VFCGKIGQQKGLSGASFRIAFFNVDTGLVALMIIIHYYNNNTVIHFWLNSDFGTCSSQTGIGLELPMAGGTP
jgi:hypothetical protein